MAATGALGQARPRRGGHLRLGIVAPSWRKDLDTLRPMTQALRLLGHGAVYDCLVEVTAAGALVGELAESWEASTDARTWVFTLRRGVVFHDNSDLTAQQVVRSMRAQMVRGYDGRVLLEDVESVEAVGTSQVVFRLRSPNAEFPFRLADPSLVIAANAGVGTGLYRLDENTDEATIHLVRVSEHYKDGNAGWFDRVSALLFATAEAAFTALRAGHIDLVDDVPARLSNRAGQIRGVNLKTVHGTGLFVVTPNRALSFEQRHGIRAALKYGIDREALVQDVFLGQGDVGFDHPFGVWNRGHRAIASAVQFDPERAVWHLAAHDLDRDTLSLLARAVAEPAGSKTAGSLLETRTWSGRLTEDLVIAATRMDPEMWWASDTVAAKMTKAAT